MIDVWEQLELAIAHDPVVVSLDATLLDIIIVMHGQLGIKKLVSGEEPVSNVQIANKRIADDTNLNDADSFSNIGVSSVVTIPASRYVAISDRDQVVGLLTERDIG